MQIASTDQPNENVNFTHCYIIDKGDVITGYSKCDQASSNKDGIATSTTEMAASPTKNATRTFKPTAVSIMKTSSTKWPKDYKSHNLTDVYITSTNDDNDQEDNYSNYKGEAKFTVGYGVKDELSN